MEAPTAFPEVNALLVELSAQVQATLGDHFIGMYLDGSLTSNDFDQASDVDFVVVTDVNIGGDLFLALQQMHDRLASLDTPLAIQLEGSYISREAIRRFDPDQTLHPNIERGEGERLKMAYHGEEWALHRYVLRERGITISGPPPVTLIDPVSPDELCRAMRPLLDTWLMEILENPDIITHRGYQCYIVLSICRILYTLQCGGVVSKRRAAEWGREALDTGWASLIDDAWEGRNSGGRACSKEEVNSTLDFIRYARQTGQRLAPTRL
jgi:hypothetical protein